MSLLDKWNYRKYCTAGSILPNALCEMGGTWIVFGTTEGTLYGLQSRVNEPIELSRFETISVVLPLAEPGEVCVVCVEGTVSLVRAGAFEFSLIGKSAGPTNCLCGARQGDLVILGSLDRRIDVLQQATSSSGRYFVRRQQVSVPGQVYALDHFELGAMTFSVAAMARRVDVLQFRDLDCVTRATQPVMRGADDGPLNEEEVDEATKSLAVGVAVIPLTSSAVTVGLVTEDGFVFLHRVTITAAADSAAPTVSMTLIRRLEITSTVPRMSRLGTQWFCVATRGGPLMILPVDENATTILCETTLDQCVSFTPVAVRPKSLDGAFVAVAASSTEVVKAIIRIPRSASIEC